MSATKMVPHWAQCLVVQMVREKAGPTGHWTVVMLAALLAEPTAPW